MKEANQALEGTFRYLFNMLITASRSVGKAAVFTAKYFIKNTISLSNFRDGKKKITFNIIGSDIYFPLFSKVTIA
jgi:hypothetical protein